MGYYGNVCQFFAWDRKIFWVGSMDTFLWVFILIMRDYGGLLRFL